MPKLTNLKKIYTNKLHEVFLIKVRNTLNYHWIFWSSREIARTFWNN